MTSLTKSERPRLAALPIEFWLWRDIPADCKREVTTHGDDWTMEVLGETFLGEPVWLPWMGNYPLDLCKTPQDLKGIQ